MATRTELISKILDKLGVLNAGETVSAAESASVSEAYDEIYAELRTDRLVNWGSADSIPDEAVRPLVTIVAADLLTSYGVSGEQAAMIKADLPGAYRRLSKAMAESYTPSNVTPDYF